MVGIDVYAIVKTGASLIFFKFLGDLMKIQDSWTLCEAVENKQNQNELIVFV